MDITDYAELTKLAETDEYIQYELFFGPNFPGMHGNFSYVLDVAGSKILDVDTSAGLLHRGFEKLMETKLWFQNISLIPRICVVDPDPNEVAYCRAVEKLCGVEAPEKAKWIRTITLEMSRITSFLMGMGAVGAMVGLYSGMFRMMNDRDLVLDLFEWLTGARVYHIFNVPGGVRRDFPEGFTDKLLDVLNELEGNLPEWDKLIFENPTIHKRLSGIGKIDTEEAIHYGLGGPNLRATGFRADTRIDDPYAAYPYLDIEVPVTEGGDALARAVQVRKEYEVSINLIRQAIKKMPAAGEVSINLGNPLRFAPPAGDVYSRVESSKGEYAYYVVSNGGIKPYRISVRGPSLPAGLALCHKQFPGMDIADVAIWMASYSVCPPDFDR
jgi:NADH-quinone oxidoreductase subunit D